MGSTHSAPKTIAELAREALPCHCFQYPERAIVCESCRALPAVESAIREAVRQERERCADALVKTVAINQGQSEHVKETGLLTLAEVWRLGER